MSATNEIPVLTISASATSSAALPKNYSATSLESPASPSKNHGRPPLSLTVPHSLRKSVSVDSFAKLTHESSPSGRGYTVSNRNASQNLVYGRPSPDSPSRPEKYPFSTRHRGDSLVIVHFRQDPSTSESDIDRYDPLTTERFRHLSLKNQEMQKPLVRGGELPLPSRTHTTSSVSEYPRRVYLLLKISTLGFSRKAHGYCCRRHIQLWKINCHSQGSFWIWVNGSHSGFWTYMCPKITSVLVASLHLLIRYLIMNLQICAVHVNSRLKTHSPQMLLFKYLK